MNRRSAILAVALLVAAAGAALARAPGPAQPWLSAPVTLPAEAPPVAGSPAEAADRAAMRQLQSARTPARIARAQADVSLDAYSAFAPVLGSRFTAAATPRFAALMVRASADSYAAVRGPKQRYARARPPVADPEIRPCVPLPEAGSNSFPSGHATWGAMTAELLAAAVPAQAAALRARGADFAMSRAVCGVHYPTDVQAGQRYGRAVAAALLADPGFRAAFDPAAAELRAALAAR